MAWVDGSDVRCVRGEELVGRNGHAETEFAMVASTSGGADGTGACVDFSLGEGDIFVSGFAEDWSEFRVGENFREVNIAGGGSHFEGLKGVNLIKLCH